MKKIALVLLILVESYFFSFPAQALGECEICEKLREKGFPEDYLEPLCALTILHPQWEFTPLNVTLLSRDRGEEYTFSYVLGKETETSEQSLVSGEEAYRAYWDLGGEQGDTGYYRASREAVAYFLDPRGHFSEQGVFQFLDLSLSQPISQEVIEEFFVGTVLENVSLSESIIALGEAYGVDPRFLSVRLRQEQGSQGNVLFFGKAGSELARWYRNAVEWEEGRWVRAPENGYDDYDFSILNGCYNPFNVSAKGNGAFEVYYNGADEALKKGWDTLEKGLKGGVEKIAEEYLSAFQNTLYLQKWNVDARSMTPQGKSRNFWGQYMQNIGAAKTEGDLLYTIYEEMKWLDSPLCFLIPIYEGMPEETSFDPGKGAVAVFAASPIPSSSHFVSLEGEKEATAAPAPSESPLPTEREAGETKWTWGYVAVFLICAAGFSFLSFVAATVFSFFLFYKYTRNW